MAVVRVCEVINNNPAVSLECLDVCMAHVAKEGHSKASCFGGAGRSTNMSGCLRASEMRLQAMSK